MGKRNKVPTSPDDIFLSGKYGEFVEDFEDEWLQYATPEEKVKAFWGSMEGAIAAYKFWKRGGEFFYDRKGWLKNCFTFSDPRPEPLED
ncbi:MAG: hypothetical protein OHK0019_09110 [Saprospiraceae bacterium]